MVMIGTLPTIRNADMTLENISPLNRYYALNNEVLRQRAGRPLRVDISGRDHLVSEHRDVMLEAATTSFQVHLKIPASRGASLLQRLGGGVGADPRGLRQCSLPVREVALGGNAHPLVRTGRRRSLQRARVSMGSGYVSNSCMELFEENLADYPVLLPMSFDEEPEALRHLRLHNGTIWRWNRALIGSDEDGAPHLRIEHRICPPAQQSWI